MATVTSFEGLSMPGKTELRQFAELFEPLYQNSSLEARRLAVAALSQCKALPTAIVHFIGCQAIDIAAPFLTASPALDDDALIAIARAQGPAHAKAIASRRNLSVKVADALAALGERNAESQADERRLAEELLRQRLKSLVTGVDADGASPAGAETDARHALMVRLSRERSARHFVNVLGDTLSSSLGLVERIMLDLSGLQLATTLLALGFGRQDSEFILTRFYTHLGQQIDGISRAGHVLGALDGDACRRRVESWLRADIHTTDQPGWEIEAPANQDAAAPAGNEHRTGLALDRTG